MQVSEIWKAVPGYEGYLEVSNMGNVKSLARTVKKRHSSGAIMKQHYPERLLNPMPSAAGYVFVHVGVNGVRRTMAVHKLVLTAFVGPKPDGMEACHSNGRASDNRLENLRWDTHLSNSRDRLSHGTYKMGEAHHMAKFTDDQRREIAGLPPAQAKAKFGVSTTHYYRLKRQIKVAA